MTQKQKPSGQQTRSDKGKPQLTPRDRDTMPIVGEQTAYRFDQLQGLLARHPTTSSADPTFLSETRTMAVIRRWQLLGLADYRKILNDQVGWIWLTAKGLAQCHLPFRFHEPDYTSLDHLFWINETRALVENRFGSLPGFQWESERRFRMIQNRWKSQQKKEPELWVPLEYQSSHRPDALFRYRQNQEPDAREVICAVETECSQKAYEEWKEIWIELQSHYTLTHYYVHPDIKEPFCKAVDRFTEEEARFNGQSQRKWLFIHDLEECL